MPGMILGLFFWLAAGSFASPAPSASDLNETLGKNMEKPEEDVIEDQQDQLVDKIAAMMDALDQKLDAKLNALEKIENETRAAVKTATTALQATADLQATMQQMKEDMQNMEDKGDDKDDDNHDDGDGEITTTSQAISEVNITWLPTSTTWVTTTSQAISKVNITVLPTSTTSVTTSVNITPTSTTSATTTSQAISKVNSTRLPTSTTSVTTTSQAISEVNITGLPTSTTSVTTTTSINITGLPTSTTSITGTTSTIPIDDSEAVNETSTVTTETLTSSMTNTSAETFTDTATITSTETLTSTLTITSTETLTFTLAPPPALCENNWRFRDEQGRKCWFWNFHRCEEAEEVFGYSLAGQEEIFAECPKACGICDPSTPTLAPPALCKNNWRFRDEQGHKCWFWNFRRCEEAEEVFGYSLAGQEEIFAECPKACGTCDPATCRNTPSFRDEFGNGCSAWQNSRCQDAVDGWGYSPRGQAELVVNCPVACGDCEPEQETPCQDVRGFRDARGWRCRSWRGHDCENAADFGYSPFGEIEILENCPRSCGLCEENRRHSRARAFR